MADIVKAFLLSEVAVAFLLLAVATAAALKAAALFARLAKKASCRARTPLRLFLSRFRAPPIQFIFVDATSNLGRHGLTLQINSKKY